MTWSRITVMCLMLSAAGPRAAQADWLLVPFAGINFGGDSGEELSDALDASQFNWGVSIGFMGAGVFGIEGDFGFSPDFFGKTDLGGTSVFSAMGNLLIGIPFGGQEGFGVRPFGLVGAGVMRTNGDAFPDPLLFEENEPAWNFGGGVLIFFTSHTGIRGDVRYFRTFEATDLLDVDVEGQGSHLDFTRGSVGFVFRF